jgi:DNA-binding NtrC family response regulator
VRIAPSATASLARLLAWDAPFLPPVADVREQDGGAIVAITASGSGLRQAMGWARGIRAAVALQLVAAGAFLFERGWHPSRALLRGCRIVPGKDGPWLRLAALPRWRLEEVRLERRLRGVFGAEETVLLRALGPLLGVVLPELRVELARAAHARPPWEAAAAWLGVLLQEGREKTALRHPGGAGRALWARRFALPEAGTHWVEEDRVLPGLLAATRLACLGREVTVAAGAWEEEEVSREQARAAAGGRDLVAITTLSLPGVSPLPLAGGIEAVWVLAERSDLAFSHAGAAIDAGAKRPAFAAVALEIGAHNAFARPPQAIGVAREQEALASPAGRRALSWLASAPVGLEASEICALAELSETALPEIERLRLAQQHSGAWCAVKIADTPDAEKLAAMAERLDEASAAGAVARALGRGEWAPLVAWCEACLANGAARRVLSVARVVSGPARLGLLAAEAALTLGRLDDAERALEAVAPAERDATWHALAAGWAEAAGLAERAAAELAACSGATLPPRLAARRELVAAELARRSGDRGGREAHLRAAASACEPSLPEAELALAEWEGVAALRRLRRERVTTWRADLKARALHLTGLAALSRGAWVAGATALRAALRLSAGENPCWLGEIHADLGYAAMFAERPGVADRHLKLAETILERCGSRRASTVVRADRAVLACDRLDWQRARELTLAAKELRGAPDDIATWLGELELARADLARGDVAVVQARLPELAAAVERHADHVTLGQAFAALRGHCTLACGDLAGAADAAARAEPGERALFDAVIAANAGREPAVGLPHRWGMVVTAHLLAARRCAQDDAGMRWYGRVLERAPREAGVGLARLVAILRRNGERLGAAWTEHERRAEATLVAYGLDGWAAILHGPAEINPLRLVRAVDAIVNAGTDGLTSERLEALGHDLGLDALLIEGGGEEIAKFGQPSGAEFEVEAGGVVIRATGAQHAVATATLELLARHVALRHGLPGGLAESSPSALIGTSQALRAVRDQIDRWGPLPLTVLITGEPGTGKELVARELHAASRRRGPFVPVNCAGIPSALLEAELFGVLRGAFTGADRDRSGLVEAAEGGTLLLDEVGELPLELQGKLLRLLQEHEVRRVGATRARQVDVRFLAATNRDLLAAVAEGSFRQDLYYRLAVAVIEVPPLRRRPKDVEELARTFVSRLGAAFNRPGVRLSSAAVTALQGGSWPGNVRELESALARAVASAHPGEVIGPDRFAGLTPRTDRPDEQLNWSEAAAAFRRAYFAKVLEACGGNRSRAARRAGISRQTLLYHLRELGMQGNSDE